MDVVAVVVVVVLSLSGRSVGWARSRAVMVVKLAFNSRAHAKIATPAWVQGRPLRGPPVEAVVVAKFAWGRGLLPRRAAIYRGSVQLAKTTIKQLCDLRHYIQGRFCPSLFGLTLHFGFLCKRNQIFLLRTRRSGREARSLGSFAAMCSTRVRLEGVKRGCHID